MKEWTMENPQVMGLYIKEMPVYGPGMNDYGRLNMSRDEKTKEDENHIKPTKPKCKSCTKDTDGNEFCASDYWVNPCDGLIEARKNCWRWRVE